MLSNKIIMLCISLRATGHPLSVIHTQSEHYFGTPTWREENGLKKQGILFHGKVGNDIGISFYSRERLPNYKFWVGLQFRYVCLSVHTERSLDLKWNMRYEIIKGICNGLRFLHDECRIIHLVLKPENILMDSNMTPKIADFGLSRIFGEQQSHIVTDNHAGTR